jgi:hypothetical protein
MGAPDLEDGGFEDWAAMWGERTPVRESARVAKVKRKERRLFMIGSHIKYMNIYQI